MRLFALAPDEIEATWPDYAHHFERFARERGDMSADQVRAAAMDGRAQIWGIQDADAVHAVVMTEVCATALGNLCVIRIASGASRVPIQERLLDEIGKWARDQGCERVRIYGRRGWLRRFPRFKQTGVIAEWTLRTH